MVLTKNYEYSFLRIAVNFPFLDETLQSIRSDSESAEIHHLGLLLNAIQTDSRLGFSLASFVRQAISLRECWMRDTCVGGRLCVSPDHWSRNFLQFPPSAAELPVDFEESFTNGTPWFFDGGKNGIHSAHPCAEHF